MAARWLIKPCRGGEKGAKCSRGATAALLATRRRNTYREAARFRFSRNGRSDNLSGRAARTNGQRWKLTGTLWNARSIRLRTASMQAGCRRHPAGAPWFRIRSRVHRGVRHALFRGHASVTAGTFEVARDAAPASAFSAVSRSIVFPNIRPQRFESRADRIRPAAAAGQRWPHEVRQCPTRC